MRTRSGFRSQLSFVPQSPNGPAGLSLAGPYYFQPECALFVTNKATEGQKEAAGENDAALVSPGARLTIHQCRICPNARMGRNGAQAVV
jgi:hypothetical protein